MKLLHIIATMNPTSGGPCQGIRNSNPEIVRYGISREVVSLDDPDADFLGSDDFIIHALGPAYGPWHYAPRLRPWLLENLSRFDAVVINGLWIYPSYAGWSAMQELKRAAKRDSQIHVPKMFVMPHGMLDPYFQNAPDRRLKAIRNWFYWKLIEKSVVDDADGILFTCETEMLLARKSFSPYHPKKEINVGYGIIPPPQYSADMVEKFREKYPQAPETPYLLFLSRIHKKKGVDLLIKAFAEIVASAVVKNIDYPNLVIAGPGLNTRYGSRIIKLLASYPQLKECVFFTGMLTGDAKWGALYGCEAFVLPSHQENFGIAVVEAMACKKPVLISQQINIWKEIDSGGGGIINEDTQEGTQKTLDEWIALPFQQKEAMGKNALDTYINNFHIGPTSIVFINSISI
ncbi:glycosyltransferase [Mucilaginibacter glaciei]|uniref:Glycosyltransferase n=1 Tax=Mucilaginibacter glaciei TaxID=2772109 RepID=A0A926S620_9SPHI|nr:glycosyltransferase [Mucilaginibacter glaciei]MBD1393311.1 glycosyltransferase [Mucilaginibacter glaciei]